MSNLDFECEVPAGGFTGAHITILYSTYYLKHVATATVVFVKYHPAQYCSFRLELSTRECTNFHHRDDDEMQISHVVLKFREDKMAGIHNCLQLVTYLLQHTRVATSCQVVSHHQ